MGGRDDPSWDLVDSEREAGACRGGDGVVGRSLIGVKPIGRSGGAGGLIGFSTGWATSK